MFAAIYGTVEDKKAQYDASLNRLVGVLASFVRKRDSIPRALIKHFFL